MSAAQQRSHSSLRHDATTSHGKSWFLHWSVLHESLQHARFCQRLPTLDDGRREGSQCRAVWAARDRLSRFATEITESKPSRKQEVLVRDVMSIPAFATGTAHLLQTNAELTGQACPTMQATWQGDRARAHVMRVQAQLADVIADCPANHGPSFWRGAVQSAFRVGPHL